MQQINEVKAINHRIGIVPLTFPGVKESIKFVAWSTGRVFGFGTVLFITDAALAVNRGIPVGVKSLSNVVEWVLIRFKKSTIDMLRWYEGLPVMGVPEGEIIDVSSRVPTGDTVAIQPLDLIASIQDKHLMILGESGSGKSTLAQWIAYSFGSVRVFECEGTPNDWPGLEVIGKGENFDAINRTMADDLEDLSNQIKLRTEKGDAALAGTNRVYIAEEYPELSEKCSNSSEWLERHARRGRKGLRFLILLSQMDALAAWGLEGKLPLLACFKRLRLGKLALKHAKTLKQPGLIEWLNSSRQHCLLDDEPCLLPSYQEMTRVANAYPYPAQPLAVSYKSPTNAIDNGSASAPPEAPPEVDFSDFSVLEGEFLGGEKALWETISALLEVKSESWVIGHFWGVTGGNSFKKAQSRIRELREKFSRFD